MVELLASVVKNLVYDVIMADTTNTVKIVFVQKEMVYILILVIFVLYY